jgi:hypothetical protein
VDSVAKGVEGLAEFCILSDLRVSNSLLFFFPFVFVRSPLSYTDLCWCRNYITSWLSRLSVGRYRRHHLQYHCSSKWFGLVWSDQTEWVVAEQDLFVNILDTHFILILLSSFYSVSQSYLHTLQVSYCITICPRPVKDGRIVLLVSSLYQCRINS